MCEYVPTERQRQIMHSDKKYTLNIGRRPNKLYAEAVMLRENGKKCLVIGKDKKSAYKGMDSLIAYGVKPSQLVLEEELEPTKGMKLTQVEFDGKLWKDS